MAKREEKDVCRCDQSKDPFVAIPASLGGIYLVIVLFVLLFAQEAAKDVLVPVAWAFVVLGFFAMLFAYKTRMPLKK